jgi:hypothetical protein
MEELIKYLKMRNMKASFLKTIKQLNEDKKYIIDVNPDFESEKHFIMFNSKKKKFFINISFKHIFGIILNMFAKNNNINLEDITQDKLFLLLQDFEPFFKDNVKEITSFFYKHELGHFNRFDCSLHSKVFPFTLKDHEKILNILFDLQINEPLLKEDYYNEMFREYINVSAITIKTLTADFSMRHLEEKYLIGQYKKFMKHLKDNGFFDMNGMKNDMYKMLTDLIAFFFDVENIYNHKVLDNWIHDLFYSNENSKKASGAGIKDENGEEIKSEKEVKESQKEYDKQVSSGNKDVKDVKDNISTTFNISDLEAIEVKNILEKYFNFTNKNLNQYEYKRTYRRPYRRQDFYKTFIKKGRTKELVKRNTVVNCIIDTSFSMTYEKYVKVLGIIESLSKKYNNTFRIAFGGERIFKYLESDNLDVVKKVFEKIPGQGTDLDHLIDQYMSDYKEKNVFNTKDKVDNIIVFTDGEDAVGNFASDINALFVCTDISPSVQNGDKLEILNIKGG